MSPFIEENRQFWADFIRMYQDMPELWCVQSNVYKNKVMKAAAYAKLAQKLKEVDPFADRASVTRKINSLRGSYRRELKKVHKLKRLGEAYLPSLWYFPNFDFLCEQESLYDGDATDFALNGSETNENLQETRTTVNTITLGKRRTKEQCDPIKVEFQLPEMSSRRNDLFEMACVPMSDNDEETEIMARCWAFQYKDLTSEQKIFAKKAIDDILFEAKLGTLHRSSVRINEN